MGLIIGNKICIGVQIWAVSNPLPDMWQQDADTGGYFIDEDTGGVITVLDEE